MAVLETTSLTGPATFFADRGGRGGYGGDRGGGFRGRGGFRGGDRGGFGGGGGGGYGGGGYKMGGRLVSVGAIL